MFKEPVRQLNKYGLIKSAMHFEYYQMLKHCVVVYVTLQLWKRITATILLCTGLTFAALTVEWSYSCDKVQYLE